MKKTIMFLVFSLFVLPLTASAASVTIVNQTTTGGGVIVNGAGTESAIASHTNIDGVFNDTWDVNIDPSGAIFSLATSNFLKNFTVEYSLNTVDFFFYNGVAEVDGLFSIQDLSLAGVSSFLLRISGERNGTSSAGYNINVNAVPVPAAAWLFGSAMLGLAGFKSRRTSGSEAIKA